MANHFEALDLDRERAAMIRKTRPFIIEALQTLGNREVSLGDINETVRELYPDGKFGMGIVPTVLDELEGAGIVICIQTPVNPRTNGHMIGKSDWRALTYRFAEPPETAIEH
ncbi:MAG: hypothetical protein ABSE17_02700 [Candidatus Levyibacteriota bacterium]